MPGSFFLRLRVQDLREGEVVQVPLGGDMICRDYMGILFPSSLLTPSKRNQLEKSASQGPRAGTGFFRSLSEQPHWTRCR